MKGINTKDKDEHRDRSITDTEMITDIERTQQQVWSFRQIWSQRCGDHKGEW